MIGSTAGDYEMSQGAAKRRRAQAKHGEKARRVWRARPVKGQPLVDIVGRKTAKTAQK